jgi:hypothetical protein
MGVGGCTPPGGRLGCRARAAVRNACSTNTVGAVPRACLAPLWHATLKVRFDESFKCAQQVAEAARSSSVDVMLQLATSCYRWTSGHLEHHERLTLTGHAKKAHSLFSMKRNTLPSECPSSGIWNVAQDPSGGRVILGSCAAACSVMTISRCSILHEGPCDMDWRRVWLGLCHTKQRWATSGQSVAITALQACDFHKCVWPMM